jgi:hypothetical protein
MLRRAVSRMPIMKAGNDDNPDESFALNFAEQADDASFTSTEVCFNRVLSVFMDCQRSAEIFLYRQ